MMYQPVQSFFSSNLHITGAKRPRLFAPYFLLGIGNKLEPQTFQFHVPIPSQLSYVLVAHCLDRAVFAAAAAPEQCLQLPPLLFDPFRKHFCASRNFSARTMDARSFSLHFASLSSLCFSARTARFRVGSVLLLLVRGFFSTHANPIPSRSSIRSSVREEEPRPPPSEPARRRQRCRADQSESCLVYPSRPGATSEWPCRSWKALSSSNLARHWIWCLLDASALALALANTTAFSPRREKYQSKPAASRRRIRSRWAGVEA
mmetsp:Transcript_20949/g.39263  ORF Transcript_20949/g.39263 Transcript_20949/m.39263 type:complete len:261 (-) Transcript_20949:868-1650(-)